MIEKKKVHGAVLCTGENTIFAFDHNIVIEEVRDHGAEEKEEPFYVLAMHTINYSW